ncbi:MAG TPA: hypothetical protein VFT53_06790, partial [Candidatus Saccharimonadales bacterium]|nr:hypothetical protein [Candidatus Saccharimonadales bacterium]
GAKAKRHPLIRILAIILLGLFLSAGILAYRYYRFASDSRATSISDPAQHTVWKTYTSSDEKASFRYPETWKTVASCIHSNDANNNDHVCLASPSGEIKISWVTDLSGLGGEHSANYPYNTIFNKTAIAKAPGLYVISGATTLDGKTYHPWIAVQDDNGIVSTDVQGDVATFTSHWATNPTTDDLTGILFSTTGARTSQSTPGLTKAQAASWFSGAEAQQAKTIMLSLVDGTNPAANWYLYVSPGFHYSARLPDGWSLSQNCTGPYAPLETYYTGYGDQNTDPLALRSGVKATVANTCFGKDGAPLISFQWYDLNNPLQDAQKLLASFSTTPGLQKQGSFQTNSGQTVEKYYTSVTTPPQDIMQPQVGVYYDYLIQNSTGFVWVLNFYPPGAVDRHAVVEEAIKTLILH